MRSIILVFILAFTLSPDLFCLQNSLTYTSQSRGVKIGDKAPEIEMSSPEGKTLKLSSLKGKIVLVDFWASWCGPCRRENPNVVRAYNKYKNAKFDKAKGFEIFSVSLDNNERAWAKAIQQDGLIWKYHVSDLKKWRNEAAQRYGVESIPSSFLIDQNGVVIAKNLRGPQIDLQLDQLVKEF